MQQLPILGIKITSATAAEINREIDCFIKAGDRKFILSANAHAVNLARSQPWLAGFFKKADIVHVDGAGIILAARLLGYSIPERLTWADWAWDLARHFGKNKYTLFLLGGPDGLAEQAAAGLKAAAPNLNIAGTHHGYFAKSGPENEVVIQKINRLSPDILWVGMGMPLQERWVLENHDKINAKVFMTCGAAYKHLAGWLKRGPKWMVGHHLEWVWLLFQDPKRGFIRYLWGNPMFLYYCLKERLRMPK